MLISRGFKLIKHASTIVNKQPQLVNKIVKRNSGDVAYRDVARASRGEEIAADVVLGVMWWWILWHMWHDWEHIIGEYDYPDTSKWTDEELGIPPDDYD